MMITLGCMLVGVAGSEFSVDIDENEDTVDDLKKVIKKKKPYSIKCDADELQLFLAKKDGAWVELDTDDVKKLKKGEKTAVIKALMHEGKKLQGETGLQEVLMGMPLPVTKQVHVLVVAPRVEPASDAAVLERLMPVVDNGTTSKWLNEFHLAQIPSHDLPLVGELKEFIEGELPVKIGMHHSLLYEWTTKMNLPSPALISKIFNTNNAEPCVALCYKVIYRLVDPIKPGNTATSFISLWNDSIGHVLNSVLSGIGKSERYWDCPNYVFILDSVCVLRGNEEAPDACMRASRRELYEKLIWIHGSVPYLFGYTTAGFDVILYAITDRGNVELGRFNLEDLEGRFKLLLAILNIARLFQGIANLCPESGRNEYRVISRQNGIKILLQPTRVVKCFPESEFEKSRHILEQLYAMLRHNRVPNVDRLVSMNLSTKQMVFEPRGIDNMKPSNIEDLFRALRDILTALVRLHALSWMHRDIRWPNVLKRRDGSESWFLIDFMDAEISPQDSSSGQHLSHEEHAPEIFNAESHTIAVDMWSLGNLIQTSGDKVYEDWYDLGGERTKFMERLLHRDPSQRPSAAEALEIVGQLEEQYLTRKKRKNSSTTATRNQRRK